jgi:hypothetical protein
MQRYTRTLKTSPELKCSSALPNSLLDLFYYIVMSSPNSLLLMRGHPFMGQLSNLYGVSNRGSGGCLYSPEEVPRHHTIQPTLIYGQDVVL